MRATSVPTYWTACAIVVTPFLSQLFVPFVDDISAIRAVLCPEPPLMMTNDVLSLTHDLPSFRHRENRLFDECWAIKQSNAAHESYHAVHGFGIVLCAYNAVHDSRQTKALGTICDRDRPACCVQTLCLHIKAASSFGLLCMVSLSHLWYTTTMDRLQYM
jgi:hypothetical protein